MQRIAEAGAPLPLFFAMPSLRTGVVDLEVRVEDDAGAELASIAVSETELAGLYQADETWLPPTAGRYTLIWQAPDELLWVVDELFVYQDPVGDFGAEQPRRFQRNYGSPGLTCRLRIYDATLLQIADQALAAVPTVSGLYRAAAAATVGSPGVYVLAWLAGGVPVAFDPIYVGVRRGSRSVNVYVGETGVAVDGVQPVQALPSCTVLASYSDGEPVEQHVTDGDGLAAFVLEEGVEHVITLHRDGISFTRNNWSFTPGDPNESASGQAVNDLHLMVDVFRPTFSPRSPLGSDRLSTMKIDAIDLSGNPAVGVRVLVNNLYSPFSVMIDGRAYGVIGSDVEAVTDDAGHAEIPLVRGQLVEVTVYGTGTIRRFTVPDVAEFSAMSAMVGGDDPFVVANPVLPTAERWTP